MGADFAGSAAVCAFCFAPAPITWHAIPFTSDSFGAKTLADVERSRHSILTGVAVCCRAKATLAEHTNTRTAIVVFTGWTLQFVAWSTEPRATNYLWYGCERRITWPKGQGSYLRAAVKALGDAACWGWGKTALGQMTSRAVSCWMRCLERRVTRMVRAFSVSVRISPRPSFSVCRLLSAR